MMLMTVVVFYTLGVLADGYLCPNMVSLSICCRMPVRRTYDSCLICIELASTWTIAWHSDGLLLSVAVGLW